MTDRENELRLLFKKNAELNSPEACAILEESKELKALCDKENLHIEPIEAIPHIPYTETAEFAGQIQDMIHAEDSIKNQIQVLNEKVDAEQAARIEYEKRTAEELVRQKRSDTRRFAFNAVVGVLSTVAAIIGAVFATLSFFS